METNKIHCIDCLEGMRQLPDNFAKLTITSPPYNVGKNHIYETKQKKYENDADVKDNYGDWLGERLQEMLRVSETVLLNIQMLSNNKIDVINLQHRFKDKFKDVMIWAKNGQPAMEPGVLNSCFEFIFVFSNNKPDKRKFYGVDFRGTVPNLFQMKSNGGNKYAKIHRALFPIELPELFINNFSKEGDIILDPFSGLGTTALASKKHKRNYIGFEIDPEYVKVTEERLLEIVI